MDLLGPSDRARSSVLQGTRETQQHIAQFDQEIADITSRLDQLIFNHENKSKKHETELKELENKSKKHETELKELENTSETLDGKFKKLGKKSNAFEKEFKKLRDRINTCEKSNTNLRNKMDTIIEHQKNQKTYLEGKINGKASAVFVSGLRDRLGDLKHQTIGRARDDIGVAAGTEAEHGCARCHILYNTVNDIQRRQRQFAAKASTDANIETLEDNVRRPTPQVKTMEQREGALSSAQDAMETRFRNLEAKESRLRDLEDEFRRLKHRGMF
ncbi:hypothetical protein V8F33_013631 [Rhypophila sp. PSN 637]